MDEPKVYRRPVLLAAGYSERELRQLVAAGELTRVRRGAYVAGGSADDLHSRHRAAVHAAFDELRVAGAVVSHGSAAVIHRLPTWGIPLQQVQVTRTRAYGGRRERMVHVRVARLAPDEVVWVDGLLVTSVARTVVDIGRAASFEAAVVIGDAALALGLAGPAELAAAVDAATRRPGASRARRAVSFLDGRSESVGESRSRVAIAVAGLPPPDLQREIRTVGGRLVGRTDFDWEDHHVLGEFDGRAKYGRLLQPGQSPGDVVFEEKRREDALRAEGFTMVRWTWPDLTQFGEVASRLRRLLT